MNQSEIQYWTRVGQDLGIEIVTPFEAVFSDGSRLLVSALIKAFGPPKGMLVHADYGILAAYAGRILEDGYGYSSNLGRHPDDYDRASMIEILRDWGWSGENGQKPDWLGC